MYNEELKGLLKSNKNIESVWLNEEGEWFTSATEGCKEVTRAEIIGEEAEYVDQEVANELEVTEPAVEQPTKKGK